MEVKYLLGRNAISKQIKIAPGYKAVVQYCLIRHFPNLRVDIQHYRKANLSWKRKMVYQLWDFRHSERERERERFLGVKCIIGDPSLS